MGPPQKYAASTPSASVYLSASLCVSLCVCAAEYEHLKGSSTYHCVTAVPIFFDNEREARVRKKNTLDGHLVAQISLMVLLMMVVSFLGAIM